MCVDWEADSKGGRIVTEPLYVGGGISTKEKLIYTEAEMKEAIYETTIAEAQVKKPRYADHDARMKHYSIHMLERWRARKKGSPFPARPRNVPNIGLHATVTRIAYLGGRTDVF